MVNKRGKMVKVGNSVVVNPGVLDPDFGVDIGGWQGRVVEAAEGNMICIEWDSVTLKQMPASVIEQSEQQGYDWGQMWLEVQDVEVATPRDTPRDVTAAQRELEAEAEWLHLGEQGRRIQKVLKGIDEDDDMAAFSTWERYLQRRLTFSFEAEVFEPQEFGPIRAGDRLKVRGIAGTVDLHGIIVWVTKKGLPYDFPLCDLEVIEKSSPNYQPVDDYTTWFANR